MDAIDNHTYCRICNTPNPTSFLTDFRPFVDMDWIFPVFECSICGVRFAVRDSQINYHQHLHETRGGGYEHHYRVAAKVNVLLAQNQLSECERYLKTLSPLYAALVHFIKEQDKTIRVLEVGCSSGFFTAFLRSSGYRAEGVDISETAIDFAKKTFGGSYGREPRLYQYDVIIHLGVIGCVDHPPDFLADQFQLLKPGGYLFFNAPNVESPRQLGELWPSTPPPDLIYLFSERSFNHMIPATYRLSCDAIHTRTENGRKIIARLLRRSFNAYPRTFLNASQATSRHRHPAQKRLAHIAARCWQSIPAMRWIDKYADQYGLLIKIQKP